MALKQTNRHLDYPPVSGLSSSYYCQILFPWLWCERDVEDANDKSALG
jgi:hypothetical protein